jgi:hypothetical protein
MGLTVNKSSRFPPLGLGIVAALTPEHWDVALLDENWGPFVYHDADPSTGSGQTLVGITAFTASASRAYEIAALYRARGVPVVMGGIHASMCTEEALRFVDAVVVGEAETAWPQVMADVEGGMLQRVYRGEWADLAGLPRPRRDLLHPGYMFASVQTSRGCPMDCEFCSVMAFNGRRYRAPAVRRETRWRRCSPGSRTPIIATFPAPGSGGYDSNFAVHSGTDSGGQPPGTSLLLPM